MHTNLISDISVPTEQNEHTPNSNFPERHIGTNTEDAAEMASFLGYDCAEALAEAAIPECIKIKAPLNLPEAVNEEVALQELRSMADKNEVFRNYIGLGYYNCHTPAVIQRSILENPAWYTAYTPYQAEIAQGRLEALLNFQTMIADLTGMDIANASLLDEATAAAEAVTLCQAIVRGNASTLWVSETCHPQTIEVIKTRANPIGIKVIVSAVEKFSVDEDTFAAVVQYPDTQGNIADYADLSKKLQAQKGLLIVATDLLALTQLRPPGEFGADVVIGSSQRFGVPMGYGGPHAAFFATRDKFKRQMPGRLIGVTHDSNNKTAYRLSLQTREQHIRRDKATSNICTAQVLLAVMASMFAIYHGPNRLKAIAQRVTHLTHFLASKLAEAGFTLPNEAFFDTITIAVDEKQKASLAAKAVEQKMNFRLDQEGKIGLSLDETTSCQDVIEMIKLFTGKDVSYAEDLPQLSFASFQRQGDILTHSVFNSYHTETDFLRYLRFLELKDVSLATSMIPLGSCTMKLNAASEMIPVTWPEFSSMHPFAPLEQTTGYQMMFEQLESWLAEITGFHSISLQPNAGSQGEYAGLLAIREYHLSRGDQDRRVCLIPQSAHGTNPASAIMAGFKVIPVACTKGGIDLDDLKEKVQQHGKELAAIMITYPSTYGIFEEGVKEVCDIIHEAGGQVYMDGANLNAQVGLCQPGAIGADVCHLNLHKTFCIPHGGGGPGMGPIGVLEHLAPFLPRHPLIQLSDGDRDASGPLTISAGPWGSPGILPISWMYIRMMGAEGLTHATRIAILSANYIANKLEPYFPTLFRSANTLIAHECIIDARLWKEELDIDVEDIAKRLIDYGFHAPTMSWPVPGTMMIEPTESESKAELDRFCDAMISIYNEIQEVKNGSVDRESNVLKKAPHTAEVLIADGWDHAYSREKAAYPLHWVLERKYWPPVGRIDNVFGDRNLVCSCPDMDSYTDS
ncbi:MAG: aminomethyl-transferring glycine dehydrogenase [Verrucomicrobiota bacterium]